MASADGLGGSTSSAGSAQVVDMVPVTSLGEGGVALTLMPPPAPPPQNLPPDCPQWAARLRDCEVSAGAADSLEALLATSFEHDMG